MLENIQENVNNYDWKAQTVGKEEVSTIISQIERGHYKTKDIDLNIEHYPLSNMSFECECLFTFMTHMKLVQDADLSYPIIVNRRGSIIDGRHRLCKAILEGQKTMKAVMVTDSDVWEYVEEE